MLRSCIFQWTHLQKHLYTGPINGNMGSVWAASGHAGKFKLCVESQHVLEKDMEHIIKVYTTEHVKNSWATLPENCLCTRESVTSRGAWDRFPKPLQEQLITNRVGIKQKIIKGRRYTPLLLQPHKSRRYKLYTSLLLLGVLAVNKTLQPTTRCFCHWVQKNRNHATPRIQMNLGNDIALFCQTSNSLVQLDWQNSTQHSRKSWIRWPRGAKGRSEMVT